MEIASMCRTLQPALRLTSARLVALAALSLALIAGGCRGKPRRPPAAPDAGTAPSAHLDGRVVDRADRAVPEARVLAFALAGVPGPFETATDHDGRFHLDHLRPGDYRVLVEGEGFPPAEKAPVAVPGAVLALRLDGEGRTIIGRVLAAGALVAGARVWLASEAGGPARETVARATGGFAFGGLGEGRYAVRAADSTRASATIAGLEAGDAATAKTVDLELGSAQSAAGRVIDDAGAGVAAIAVRVEASA